MVKLVVIATQTFGNLSDNSFQRLASRLGEHSLFLNVVKSLNKVQFFNLDL